MIPLVIWAAAMAVIVVVYLLGPKAMLVALVALGLVGMRAIWNPKGRR
ncbi:MAG TPA: hypothetical protein VFT04_09870 [Gemmatimonadales bacterium]|nr:hypothetical protein [Gemmatimonadales bacterium]